MNQENSSVGAEGEIKISVAQQETSSPGAKSENQKFPFTPFKTRFCFAQRIKNNPLVKIWLVSSCKSGASIEKSEAFCFYLCCHGNRSKSCTVLLPTDLKLTKNV